MTTDTDDDGTDFRAVCGLGELDPAYFEELMNHNDTEIIVEHDGKRLFDGGSDTLITRPRMREVGGSKRVKFGVEIVVPSRKDPTRWQDNGPADDDDGEEYEGHMRFSMEL